jgi:hypothetical protein
MSELGSLDFNFKSVKGYIFRSMPHLWVSFWIVLVAHKKIFRDTHSKRLRSFRTSSSGTTLDASEVSLSTEPSKAVSATSPEDTLSPAQPGPWIEEDASRRSCDDRGRCTRRP